MIKRILFVVFVIFVLFFCLCWLPFARAWDKVDTSLEAGFIATCAVDYFQTRWMIKNNYYELNPILGKHPSETALDIYMPCAIILHGVISMALPKHLVVGDLDLDLRNVWQSITIAIEGANDLRNANIGVKMSF